MRALSVLIAAALCLAACAQSPAPISQRAAAPAPAPGGDLEHFISLYSSDRGSVDRFYSVRWSATRAARQNGFVRQWREQLIALDFDALNQHGKVDWLLMRDHLESELADQALASRRLAEMEPLLPFLAAIAALEESRWRSEQADWEAAAGTVSDIAAMARKVRERVERGRNTAPDAPSMGDPEGPLVVTPVVARRAAAAVSGLRWSLQTWYAYYDGYVPGFSWWVRKPYEQAGAALDEYARYLREEIAGQRGNPDDPLVGDPIGAEALDADLRAEFIPYSPEELIAIGQREMAWCQAEMKRAAADMGFGDDWKAALAEVKRRHVPPGEQATYAAAQVREGIEFVRSMVSIPPLCEETWRTTMISPETQKVLPFAAYSDQHMMVAYPTDAMPHDDKLMSMRGNNMHFTRIVAPHEMIPGHHLQGFMAERFRPYRRLFSTPFFVEGWALYWEMTLWDEGYARGPEDRIGMLFWRMHRCARIIVSLNFHLGRMTPAEMIDYLVENVGHERFGATSEVRRYIAGDYSPLYQCAYMIGGLQLRALRREAVDSGRMTAREFHDTLLTVGAIPIELIRAELLDLPLSRGTAPAWRFADPLDAPAGRGD